MKLALCEDFVTAVSMYQAREFYVKYHVEASKSSCFFSFFFPVSMRLYIIEILYCCLLP